MDAAVAASDYVGVREFARRASLALKRDVAASTITRAVQGGRISKRDSDGKIPWPAGYAEWRQNTDPEAALGFAIRDGLELPLSGAAPSSPAMQAPMGAGGSGGASAGINAIKTAQAEIALKRDQLAFAEEQKLVAQVAPLRAAFVKQIAGFVAQVETALPDAAQLLASELQIDRHVAQVLLRRWYRDLRAKLAQTARAQGEALSDLAAEGEVGGEEDVGSEG